LSTAAFKSVTSDRYAIAGRIGSARGGSAGGGNFSFSFFFLSAPSKNDSGTGL
jgi:hypothetical protein